MKKILIIGPFLFAMATAGFGVIQLGTQNFLTTLLPFSSSIPIHLLWVYIVSIILVVAAAAILFNIQRGAAAAITGALFFLFFLILHVPKLLGNLKDPLELTVAFETLLIGSGGFIIAAEFLQKTPNATKLMRIVISMAPLGRYLIAFSLIVFGVLHVRYTSFIQKMIPAWMPGHVFLAVIVIFGFFLAALSFILNIKVTLASTLLGIMFLLWVLLVHVPQVINNYNSETEWISLCIALACSGTAFSIASGTLLKTKLER
jgi:uncharacterized membrane protein YphA (DoxX/SURF4 family)